MKLIEDSMNSLEASIPKLAQGAFQSAHDQELTISCKVMRAVIGTLVETYAERTKTVVRAIHRPIKIAVGARYKLMAA